MGVETVTTVPTEESEAERRALQEEWEERLISELPILDEKILEMLMATHGEGTVTTGLLLAEAIGLTDLEELAGDFESTPIAVWRTDYVCLPGTDFWPNASTRFAYLDGVERGERLSRELQNSSTPVTGAHIPLNAFAIMQQEAVALREPGVLLEAARLEIPVAKLQSLGSDPRVEQVRFADFPIEWLDLSDQTRPECEDG